MEWNLSSFIEQGPTVTHEDHYSPLHSCFEGNENYSILLNDKDEYTIMKLGEGCFGKVDLVTNHKLGMNYAKKTLKKYNQAQAERESEILMRIQSARNSSLLDIHQVMIDRDEGHFVVRMEHGSFTLWTAVKYMVSTSKRLTDGEIILIYLQLYNQIVELSHLHICHRDIKPKNIIITADRCIKLIDFGLAEIVSEGEQDMSICGTLEYIHPDILEALHNNESKCRIDPFVADLFSLKQVMNWLVVQIRGYESFDDLLKRHPALKDIEKKLEYKQLEDVILEISNNKTSSTVLFEYEFIESIKSWMMETVEKENEQESVSAKSPLIFKDSMSKHLKQMDGIFNSFDVVKKDLPSPEYKNLNNLKKLLDELSTPKRETFASYYINRPKVDNNITVYSCSRFEFTTFKKQKLNDRDAIIQGIDEAQKEQGLLYNEINLKFNKEQSLPANLIRKQIAWYRNLVETLSFECYKRYVLNIIKNSCYNESLIKQYNNATCDLREKSISSKRSDEKLEGYENMEQLIMKVDTLLKNSLERIFERFNCIKLFKPGLVSELITFIEGLSKFYDGNKQEKISSGIYSFEDLFADAQKSDYKCIMIIIMDMLALTDINLIMNGHECTYDFAESSKKMKDPIKSLNDDQFKVISEKFKLNLIKTLKGTKRKKYWDEFYKVLKIWIDPHTFPEIYLKVEEEEQSHENYALVSAPSIPQISPNIVQKRLSANLDTQNNTTNSYGGNFSSQFALPSQLFSSPNFSESSSLLNHPNYQISSTDSYNSSFNLKLCTPINGMTSQNYSSCPSGTATNYTHSAIPQLFPIKNTYAKVDSVSIGSKPTGLSSITQCNESTANQQYQTSDNSSFALYLGDLNRGSDVPSVDVDSFIEYNNSEYPSYLCSTPSIHMKE